ncbi:hypothetical protein C8Q73DRAFT_729156 [Cubamyces lactineus]|nr:hypothetical protein C8Q73DRAFT_729156 [Cubamyces lactineus]
MEPLQCSVDISRSIISCHGTPMYHGLGSDMFTAAPILGLVLATFKPASPPTVPSPDVVWNGIVATKADFTWGVPSFVEQWSRDQSKVEAMKQMRGIMFGGAPLKKSVGDALASQGVSLYNIYGSTEVGLMTLLVRENPGLDWEYFRLSPRHACAFVPLDDDKFEIVVPSRSENPLPVTNTKLNGGDAYATSDIVVRHPTDETLWKVLGRTDEQIILSNGENTNPVPLEAIINDDPHVKASLIFGHGRFQNGVLIEPAVGHTIDPDTVQELERFRNEIWPSIQRANEFAPQHSRIFKEMILVASPSKPFQYNVKGLLRRKFILSDYEPEINALYHVVENSAISDVLPPASWTERNMLKFVRDIVQSTLERSITDDMDIFQSGGDSLQATRIRNIIRRSLRHTGHNEEAGRLPPDIVFDSPTISQLTRVVFVSGNQPEASNSVRSPDDLWSYVEKYTAGFPARPENLLDRPCPERDVILITGTTRGFGCDVLEHLLRDERVERVFAFNRKNSKAAMRQRKHFRARGLNEKLLDSPKFVMVEGVLDEDGFGIPADLLDEIRRSVTHILHNAWRVDFNISLPSFEANLRGTHNLIELALASPYKTPPSLIFVSSVIVFTNYRGVCPALEAPLDDPAVPFGTSGYAEAKWITERILQTAAQTTSVHTVVVRLGQVCGDRTGHWNEREWVPALVKSGHFLGCLPKAAGSVSWIPSYEAARAFAEMRHSRESVLHLVHPRRIPWNEMIAPIASQLDVPLVPYEHWLARLQENIDGDTGPTIELMEKSPALRIVSFFTSMTLSPEIEPLGRVYLSTEKSTAASPTLAALTRLNERDVQRWMDRWKKSGFLCYAAPQHPRPRL